jgi:uncharacterized DUF497 family protein
MKIEYDPVKNERNIVERALSFDRVVKFDFVTALYVIETRYRSLGYIENRLYALVFVEIQDGIRVISFRKANQREIQFYEKATGSRAE